VLPEAVLDMENLEVCVTMDACACGKGGFVIGTVWCEYLRALKWTIAAFEHSYDSKRCCKSGIWLCAAGVPALSLT